MFSYSVVLQWIEDEMHLEHDRCIYIQYANEYNFDIKGTIGVDRWFRLTLEMWNDQVHIEIRHTY